MYEIPKPELLNPDRVDRDDREDMSAEDHRSRSQLLAHALDDSCGYATQLWDQLNAVRAYLLASLPSDPRRPGPHRHAASPTGPDDDEGWQRWTSTFASTTSVLCGAHGDSGFGLSRAREEAQLRRTAPVMTTMPDPSTADEPPRPTERPAGPEHSEPTPARRWSPLSIAGAAVIGALAVRGLRRPPVAR